MDEAVSTGIDDRFSGLGDGETSRHNRWCRRVGARDCPSRRSERGGAPSSVSTSVSEVVRAAVRGARTRVWAVRCERLPAVSRSASVGVGAVMAGGAV